MRAALLASTLIVGGAAAATCVHCGGGDPPAVVDAGEDVKDAGVAEVPTEDAADSALPDVAKPDACAYPLTVEPTCTQPAPAPACAGGFCAIRAGCFVLGTPNLCEFGRGKFDEDPAQVTLTHDFEMQETEMTQGIWSSLGFPNPVQAVAPAPWTGWSSCVAPNCPVSYLKWVDTLAAANAMSEKNGLPKCYTTTCTGSPGVDYMCTDVKATTTSIYDCLGYRVPTEAEWEYAARGGTTTSFVNGNVTPGTDTLACEDDSALLAIGWYCKNSGTATHPVKGKLSNPWGLYDLNGNVMEFTVSKYTGAGHGASPQVDPGAVGIPFTTTTSYVLRGGSAFVSSALSRTARRAITLSPNVLGGPNVSFRLVRTLPKPDAGAPVDGGGD